MATRTGANSTRVRTILVSSVALIALLFTGSSIRSSADDRTARLNQLNVRIRTAHYELAGTVAHGLLEEYGRVLEYVHAEYARGFEVLLRGAGGREPRGAEGGAARRTRDNERFRVVIFAKPAEYHEFGREFIEGGTEHTSGVFHPRLQMLLILDQEDRDETYSVLFHEAFHQFLSRYVPSPPIWLNEGLATYYGTARVTHGGLVFDRVNEPFWGVAAKLLRVRKAIPLSEVVGADYETFYDAAPMDVSFQGRKIRRREAFYAEAYTLVDLLLADPQGRQRLQELVRALANDDGSSSRRLSRAYFDEAACERLAPFWARHVQSRARGQ